MQQDAGGEAPDVLGYQDFRAYLRAYYAHAKGAGRGFSFRAFSKEAGFSSPNFLKLVMDGDRNLGPDGVARFAAALRLDPTRRRYFERLVDFCQARTPEERNDAFGRLRATRVWRRARRIDGDLYDYLSHWYYPAIREMAARPDFRDDPGWVGAQLVPPVRAAEAEEALRVLLRLGLLVRDADGRVGRGEPTLTTGPEVQALAARNYHVQMLERAVAAIDLVPPDRRDLGAVTVCISRQAAAGLKREVQEFRRAVLARCDADDRPEVVYQLNIQLFPLSGVAPEEEAR